MLSVAKKYRNQVFGNEWTVQDHTYIRGVKENFSNFVGKDHWTSNSPEFNPLNCYIWDEFVQQMNWNKIQSRRWCIEIWCRNNSMKNCTSSTNCLSKIKWQLLTLLDFVENFTAHLFKKDKELDIMKIEKVMIKILRLSFILSHPLFNSWK